MGLKSCSRLFDGKKFDFFLFADNKADAQFLADRARRTHPAYIRTLNITGSFAKRTGHRYSLWIRDK